MILQPDSQHQTQLQLIRFTREGANRIDTIDFDPGFNLVAGTNQAGRTRLLRSIRYAMGGSHSRIDQQFMERTKEVSLEFLANGQRVITKRGFQSLDGKFPVLVEGHPPLSMSPNEMGKFLLELLGI